MSRSTAQEVGTDMAGCRLLGDICTGADHPLPRTVVVAAHPDDETIGAGAVISRLRDCVIVHLTDGAPRHPRFVPPDARGAREDYARRRRDEVTTALGMAGVTADRIVGLNAVDQEAVHDVPALVARVMDVVRAVDADLVITHAYEGGHPDHDAAALVVDLARRALIRRNQRPPLIAEMTSYHDRDGCFVTGEFLAGETHRPAIEMRLSSEEKSLKRRMLACFITQRDVLVPFGVDAELLRMAPRYDFARPPHPGLLLYERLGWPTSGEEWRTAAARSLRALECER